MAADLQRSVSVMVVRGLAAGLLAAGVDPHSVVASAGLDVAELENPDGRVPHEQVVELWRHAPVAVGDASFGLHAAEFIQSSAVSFGRLDILDYLVRVSRTLGEALGRFERHQRMLNEELIEIALERGAGSAKIVVRLLGVPAGSLRHAAECAVATLWLRVHALTGGAAIQRAVSFRHARPVDVTEHQRIFGAPLCFDAEVDALTLAADALDLPLATADPKLCALLDRQALEVMAHFSPKTTLEDRVRRQMYESLCGGDASIESVAVALGLGVRSLQRQLRAEGLLYKSLLDELRCEIATRQLEAGERTIAEVAFLLGFSEVSAFHRAFRRWTGKTPAAFRGRG